MLQVLVCLERPLLDRRKDLMDEVIDFRFRPVGAQSWTRETTFHYLERMQLDPTPSFEHQSVDLMFDEMDEAGIALGVIGVPGPTGIRGLDPVGGDAISELTEKHPTRFLTFGSVEPSDIESAASTIREMGEAGVKGVTIDPSTAQVHRQFHDRALYPLYEEAAKHQMLVTTTQSCLLGPYMEDCRPEYVDRVATDFPNLRIVIQHGGWPYVHEAIGVLYKQPNVYMVPGQYIHYGFPGSNDYIEALRRQCSHQIIFGSVYPNCGSLKDLRSIVSEWGLPEATERRYLRENAASILNL